MNKNFLAITTEKMTFNSDNSGFTLVEIIAVLILLGILSAVAVTRFTDNSAELIGETEIVKGHLRFAQMKAMNASDPWNINFSSSSYSLEENGAASSANLPGEGSATHTLPSGITVSSTINPVSFDNWGSPGATTITVTLTDGSNAASITVTKNTGYIP